MVYLLWTLTVPRHGIVEATAFVSHAPIGRIAWTAAVAPASGMPAREQRRIGTRDVQGRRA